jgi:hypothetical protein
MKKSPRQQLIDVIRKTEGYHGRGYCENVPGYVFDGYLGGLDDRFNDWRRKQIEKRAILKLTTRQGEVNVCARQLVEVLQLASDAVGLEVDRYGLHVKDGNLKWDFKSLNDLKADFTVSIPLQGVA